MKSPKDGFASFDSALVVLAAIETESYGVLTLELSRLIVSLNRP